LINSYNGFRARNHFTRYVWRRRTGGFFWSLNPAGTSGKKSPREPIAKPATLAGFVCLTGRIDPAEEKLLCCPAAEIHFPHGVDCRLNEKPVGLSNQPCFSLPPIKWRARCARHPLWFVSFGETVHNAKKLEEQKHIDGRPVPLSGKNKMKQQKFVFKILLSVFLIAALPASIFFLTP